MKDTIGFMDRCLAGFMLGWSSEFVLPCFEKMRVDIGVWIVLVFCM
jgi:hypothetical protein